jgi:chemotaxis protein CheX
MDEFHQTEAGIALPAILDAKAAAPLLEFFIAQRGADLRCDGRGVRRLGGQCLQVLLAAQAAWAADGCAWSVAEPSPELVAALALLGASATSLCG